MTSLKRNIVAAVTSLLCASLPMPGHAQLQGKLFTTPEQRSHLDALRRDFLASSRESGFNIQESEVPPLPPGPVQVPPQRVEYTLSGIMARRDGTHTIWLNDRSYTETDLPQGISLVSVERGLALRFRTQSGEKLLLPGQTLELNSGLVQERYQRSLSSPSETIDETEQP